MPDFTADQRFETTFPAPLEARRLTLEFTGSGSEYFRIWMVNMLLIVVTLSLYYPWAKVRRLRYFHGNTLVGGYPLDFHGKPKTMLRGFLLVGAMLLLYSLAGHFSPMAGLVAFCIFAGLWPALMRASLQFRMANTSWRGLRLRFTGGLGGAYTALLPLFAPALMVVGLTAVESPTPAGQASAGKWLLVVLGLSLLVLPLLMYRLKRYQHDHFAIADQQSSLQASVGSFYAVSLKTLGIVLLTAVLAGVVAGVLAGTGGKGLVSGIRTGAVSPLQVMLMSYVAVATVYGAMLVTAGPYYVTRMQNLLWSRTASIDLRFHSRLRFWPVLRLAIKNLLLIVLTLGLYWPFAKIASARMRLAAVTVTSLIDPDDLVAADAAGTGDAAGDAAGDLFGFDIGL